ncbi:ABC transporter permease, partial [Acidobacteriota bacterium]
MSSWSAMIAKPEGTEEPEVVRLNEVDDDYVETMGMTMVEGRWFSSEFPSDESDAVVVNEAFVRRFNVAEPTERTISEFLGSRWPGKIIGVVRDFNFDSLRGPIEPAMINLSSDSVQKVFIKITEGNPGGAIDIIEREFAAVVPGYPFLYSFLDEEVANQYESEKQWSLMVTIVCLLTILIACSGVFALALKMAAGRTKEIGVRKVLGASVLRIMGLLVGEFIWIAGAAVVLAWPAAFFTMYKVLAGYPYRIPLSLWMFIVGGVVVVMVTLATVSLQAARAAVRDPVESLRHE